MPQRLVTIQNLLMCSMLVSGPDWEGLDTSNKGEDDNSAVKDTEQRMELCEAARIHFDKAAEGGDPLALEWLTRVPYSKEHFLS